MKVWEYCRDMFQTKALLLKKLGIETDEFDWKRFARTGDCNGLKCYDCPFNGTKYCNEPGLKKILKKEYECL